MKKTLSLMCAMLALTGCEEKNSYPYLIEHPDILKQEILDCQSAETKSKAQSSQCEIVMYAAANLMSILNDQQQDPERFGQRIMKTESEYAVTQTAYLAASASLAALKKQQAASEVVNSAQETFDKAEKAFLEKRDELRLQMAVVGINSPK